MTIIFPLLDAIGGILMAFTILCAIRMHKSYKYKYEIPGIITDSKVFNNLMSYTVSFNFDGKIQSKEFQLKLRGNHKKKAYHSEMFDRSFNSGRKFKLMSKDLKDIAGVIPKDNPKYKLIVFAILVIFFHLSALYFTGNIFYSLN